MKKNILILLVLLPLISFAQSVSKSHKKSLTELPIEVPQYTDYVNVMDFGCIANDTGADNSIYINRAIEYANSKNIRNVVVPRNRVLYLKNAIKIRHSNISLINEGKLVGRNGSKGPYSVRLGVILAAPEVSYHGDTARRLQNISIIGGEIDLTAVSIPVYTEIKMPNSAGDWGIGHTIEVNGVTNCVVSGITIKGAIMGCIGLGNVINGVVEKNYLVGLRNVPAGPNFMQNGNMINVYSLDPIIINGEDNYLGGITIRDNVLDGLTPGYQYPFYMDGAIPFYGANIGINIASDPYTKNRGRITGINILNNKIRHCIWGANIEGQFDEGSNSGCIMDGNTIEDVYYGIAHITNSRDANNAYSFMLLNTVIKRVLGDAIQSYGSTGIISNMLVEDIGLGLKNDTNIVRYFNDASNYKFATVLSLFPFNLSATSVFEGGNLTVENIIVRNTIKNDTSLHRCQIRGINIYVKNDQIFRNITIRDVKIDLKKANVENPDTKLASGLIIEGRVKNLIVEDCSFEGFAGAGIIFKAARNGSSNNQAAEGVTVQNCTFRNNNNSLRYGGWPTIIIESNIKNFNLFNCTFDQTEATPSAVNAVIGVLGSDANGSMPLSCDQFNLRNNRYFGYKLGLDVYDLQETTNVYIDDSGYFSSRDAIPAANIKYYAGTRIYKKTIAGDKIYGWVCSTSGVGGSAVWKAILIK
jgi:hypothetical protein